MITADKIAIVGLLLTALTSACAVYLAYAALRHTVRPNIVLRMTSASKVHCGSECLIVFEVVNIGHWYGSPMAVDVTVYCDFPLPFELRELAYGSVQEHRSTEVKAGKGGMRYLKAKGIKLSRQEYGEEIHVLVRAPDDPGTHVIRLSAFSANGASFSTPIKLDVVSDLDQVVLI